MDDLSTPHMTELFGWHFDNRLLDDNQLFVGFDVAESAASAGAPPSPDLASATNNDDTCTTLSPAATPTSDEEARQRDELLDGCDAGVAQFCRSVVEDGGAGRFLWHRLDAGVAQVRAYVSKTARQGVQAAFDARMSGDERARGCVLVQSNGKPGAWIIASRATDFLPTEAVAGIASGRPTCKEGWHENSCRQRDGRSFLNVQLGLRAWFSVDNRHCLFVGTHDTSRKAKKLRRQTDEPPPTADRAWSDFNPCFGDSLPKVA